MAEPGDPDYRYSINRHNTNGTQTDFAISFEGGYLSAADIQVRYQDAVGNTTSPSFTMPDAATVSVSPAPAAGGEIIISRNTPLDKPLVDFTDTAVLNEAVLDINAKQAIFVAAETRDRFFEMEDRSELALGTAAQAITTANTALTNANSAITTANAAAVTANNAAVDAAFAIEVAEDTATQFDDLVETVEEIAGGDFTQFAKLNAAGTFLAAMGFADAVTFNQRPKVGSFNVLIASDSLNAATFGGQGPAYYTSISDRLGYTPANRAGDTFSGPVASATFNLTGIPNAGWLNAGGNPVLAFDSGDYISYDRSLNHITNVIGNVERMRIEAGGLLMLGPSGQRVELATAGYIRSDRGDVSGVFYAGPTVNNRYVYNDTAGDWYVGAPGKQTFYFNGMAIWNAGYQGPGTGMNADLLDGYQASDFYLKSDFSFYNDGAGYYVLPGGFCIQWVNVTVSAGAGASFGWRRGFSNLLGVVISGRSALSFSGSYSAYGGAGTIGTSGGTVYGNNGSGANSVVCVVGFGTV